MINKLLKIATKLTGLTEGEIKAKHFEGDEPSDSFEEAIFDAVSAKLETRGKDFFDKGFKKAEGQYKGIAEKKFIELTGVSADETDAIDELIEKYKEANANKSKVADIKVHPDYLALEKNSVKKTEYDALKADFEKYKYDADKNVLIGSVKPKVWQVVSEMNPIIESNPKVAETRKNIFVNSVISGVDIVQSGDDVILMKDGKRLEDKLGNPVSFESYVKAEAENYFEFNKQEPKGGAGNGQPPPAGAAKWPAPNTIDEFNKQRQELSNDRELLKEYHYFGKEALKKIGIEI